MKIEDGIELGLELIAAVASKVDGETMLTGNELMMHMLARIDADKVDLMSEHEANVAAARKIVDDRFDKPVTVQPSDEGKVKP